MHCPNCGSKASDTQKFCRSCGMGLEKVHHLLTQEVSPAELSHQSRLRRFERLRNIVGGMAFATLAMTLLVVFIREIKLNIERGSPELWPAVIGLLILLGVISSLTLTVYTASLRGKRSGLRKEALGVSDATVTKELPDEVEYIRIASVTEGTTEILERDKNRESRDE